MNIFPNERRGHPRVSWEVILQIHCHTGDLIQGRTVDISESGISAIVPLEMMVGQAVELRFELLERISVQAVVKNKRAFRYGFEFVLGHSERESIRRGCTALAFE
jgi:hypothetical protein